MAGFAIDETPVPDETLGFELPDADAKIYSLGFDYQITPQTKIGLAYLYDDKDDRDISQGAKGINGTFTKGGAHLVTAGIKYTY
jgi:long-chain fatty acid transport protein